LKILLYAPDLTGHPQVYCRVIGDILLDVGVTVFIAAATDSATVCNDWYALAPLADNQHVQFLDTRMISDSGGGHLTAEELRELQVRLQVDSTLFIEGDWFREQFVRIASGNVSSLYGKNVAICSKVNQWYPGEDAYTGKPISLMGPTVRTTLGNLKRSIFNRREQDRYFYETVLVKKKAVDALIVKDERITEKYGPPVYWMPEIYRVFDYSGSDKCGEDWNQYAGPIRAYVSAAGVDNVLLYFGTGTFYKGYDYFLKLASMDASTYALHAGAPRRQEPQTMAFDTDRLRQALLQQERLFETNSFVKSAKLIDLLFHSVERFVSTHRLTLSSGTMLQALEAGKPVLVPGTGLVGWRVQRFGLGQTYRYLDENDLCRSWREFRNQPISQYQQNISSFMNRFSRERVRSFFLEQLCS
jgi:hypothetical protein